MADYEYYNPNENPTVRRARAMDRLYQLAQSRQAFTDAMYRRTEQQRMEQEAKQQTLNQTSLDDAASGAQQGLAMGGPWGALVGGALGLGKGVVGGYAARKNQGMSGGKNAFWTAADVLTGGIATSAEKARMGDAGGFEAAGNNAIPGLAAYGGQMLGSRFGGQPQSGAPGGFGQDWADQGNADEAYARAAAWKKAQGSSSLADSYQPSALGDYEATWGSGAV